ncbi:MAG: tetratricopeptide repeat protein [Planktothrix sp. GU0601_MAG3]|nr:MAG: tetratricopeptide repeat protein [Planktothrix sp. GU0601_MAG3]
METVAFLSVQWGEGFYHWMYDVLPGIHLIQQSGISLDSIDYFVFNSYHLPFQKQTLQKLGIPESKIIESRYQPHIQAKKVIAPAPNFSHNITTAKWICHFLREAFFSPEVNDISPYRRIYISREKASYRHIVNQDKLLKQLDSFGFERVILEHLTFSKQVELMATASVVIAPHGAGLSNIVFCQPGTKVIELFTPGYVPNYYQVISNICNLEHYYLIGEIGSEKTAENLTHLGQQNMPINLEEFIQLLKLAGITETCLIFGIFYREKIMQQSETANNSVIILYQQVSFYLAQKQYEEAIAVCQQILKLQPNFALAYSTLGLAKQLQGKLDDAKSWYTKALDLKPDWAEVHANLGTVYVQQQQWQDALQSYQTALHFKPNQARIYQSLYTVLINLNQPEEATNAWYEALILEPQCVPAQDYIDFGKTLIEKGKLDQALELYRKGVEVYPNLPQSYYWLGEALSRKQQWEEAIAAYNQAIILNPQNNLFYQSLADALVQQKNYEQAIANYQKAIELSPDFSWTYHQLGNAFSEQEKWQEATVAYYQGIALNPKFFGSYYKLGEICSKTGKPAEAINWYRQALEINPDSFWLHFTLGNALCETQEFEQALIEYYQAIEFEPNTDWLYPPLGKVLTDQKQWNQAIKVYCKAVELNSNHLWLLEKLAEILIEQQEIETAISVYQEYLKFDPKADIIHYNLGNLYKSQSQWESAIASYQTAININPNHLWLLEELIKTLLEQQQTEIAILVCQKLLEIAPKADILHYDLARIYHNLDQLDDAILFYQNAINLNFKEAKYYAELGEVFLKKQDLDQAMFNLMESLKIKSDLFQSYDNIAKILQQQGKTEAALSCYNYRVLPQSIIEKYCVINAEQLITSESSSHVTYISVYPSSQVSLKHSPTLAKDHLLMSFNQIENRNAFVVTLDNGRVWGSAVVTAIITAQNELLTDMSTGCAELVLSSNKLPPVYKIEGTVAFLSTQCAEGFYHWMYELLPGIHLIQKSGISLDSIDYFVVNSCNLSFQKQTLEILNIPESKIIESRFHHHIQAQKIIVPAPNIDHIASPWICQFLKQQLVSQEVYKVPAHRRLYISRGQATHRHILNEDQLLQSLKPLNFEKVVLEALTIAEQAELMASASVVLAPHGAGLSHLVFCQPGTKVIELFTPNYIIPCYRIISNICDLEYYYLIGEIIEDEIENQAMDLIKLNMRINLNNLLSLLELAEITVN